MLVVQYFIYTLAGVLTYVHVQTCTLCIMIYTPLSKKTVLNPMQKLITLSIVYIVWIANS